MSGEDNNIGPNAVFSSDLLDASGQPNIFIDRDDPIALFWRVHNSSIAAEDLVITPFGSSVTGPNQFHYLFTFQPGAFTGLPTAPDWEFFAEREAGGSIKSLYASWIGKSPVTITPGDDIVTVLTYVNAVQSNTFSKVTSVTFTAGKNVTLGGASIEGKAFGPKRLSLVALGEASTSAPPLTIDFVGRRTVLNDGKTPNSFTFAITNMTAADLKLAAETQPAPTSFTVWFDAAPNSAADGYAWALARIEHLASNDVVLTLPSADWKRARNPLLEAMEPGNPQWTLSLAKPVTLKMQDPLLFTFSGVLSDLPPGITRMYFQYHNLPGFHDGVVVANLEKTPFLYGVKQGEGLYISAGIPPGPTPPAINCDSGLTIRQFGTAPAAIFTGGGVEVSPAGGLPSAILKGPVRVDLGFAEDHGLSVSGGSAQAMLSVKQDGDGNAVEVSGKSAFSGHVVVDVSTAATAGLNINSNSADPALAISQSGAGYAAEINGKTKIAGNLDVAGLLSVSGSVASFGAYEDRTYNVDYPGEETDGFAIAVANWPDSAAGLSLCNLFGYIGQERRLVASATGGNFGTYIIKSPSDWAPIHAASTDSLCYPVPRGTPWRVDFVQNPDNQVPSTAVVYFVPLSGPPLAESWLKLQGQQSKTKEPPTYARTMEPDVEASIAQLVNELVQTLDIDIGPNQRRALEISVLKLMQFEPTPKAIETYLPAMDRLADILEKISGTEIKGKDRAELIDTLRNLL